MSQKNQYQSALRTLLLTLTALAAFAANSVFCRMALGADAIDAASFTSVRLGSGAIMLSLLVFLGHRSAWRSTSSDWVSALFLFLYAASFSFAYLDLGTGTGALILFGTVQLTMILFALWSGERPPLIEWLGILLAIGGLLYLLSPGLDAPPLGAAFLMAISGASWGIYSLRGRLITQPLIASARNFLWAVPLTAALSMLSPGTVHLSREGLILAVLSGALASGMGYVIWYAALSGLTATRAAAVQLAVPVLAAAGGVLFMSEQISVRLIVASMLILGGVALAMQGRQPKPARLD